MNAKSNVKIIWALFALELVQTCWASKDESVKEEEILLPSVNTVVDILIRRVQKIIVKKGYDPMILPDYEVSFPYMGIIGKLELSGCRLYNLSTIYRSGNVTHNKVENGINVKTSLSFIKIKVNCTYDESLLAILHRKGEVVIKLPNLTADIDMDVQITKLSAHLNNLHLKHNGFIDVHMEGGLIDELISILTLTISNLFKNVILYQVEGKLEDEMKVILEGEAKRT